MLELKVGADVVVRNTSAEAVVISAVEPKSLEKKADATLVLTGRAFASYEFDVTLGGHPVDIVSRTDTQLVVKLRTEVGYPVSASSAAAAAPEEPGYEAVTDVPLTGPSG